VSLAYAQDGDLPRARGRIEALNVVDPAEVVSVQADLAMSEGEDPTTIRALTNLAVALGGQPQSALIFAGTPVAPATVTPTLTPTLTATPTPLMPAISPSPLSGGPTPTITPTPILSYELVAQHEICSDEYPTELLEVYVRDEERAGMPGIEVLVQWAGGEDRFFTGLKPEVDVGYADFEMTPGETYMVSLANLSEPVVGLAAETCYTESGTPVTTTYRLVFAP
jgi:hypothetical protein